MSVYQLTPEEREEVAALQLALELEQLHPRRTATEIVLLRRLALEVRRILPRHLQHFAPVAFDLIQRIPLPGQKPAWDSLTAEHFEQPDLLK